MNIEIINSKGEMLILPQNDKFILQQWDGFATPSHSLITAKAPEQIGSTVINRTFSVRTLNIDFVIKSNSRQEVFDLRREVLKILNPLYKSGTLKWKQNDGTIYQINVELENLQMPGGDGQGNTFQLVQLTFLAEDPRWYDENITTIDLNVNETTSFMNSGDTKTSCVITINGPIENPVITNLNKNEKIEINYQLLENEQLVIDSKFGQKNVIFVNDIGQKSSVLRYLDLNSKLFYLETKENIIEVKGRGTTSETFVKLEFFNRFIGI